MGTFLISSRQLSSRVGASTVEMYICVCVRVRTPASHNGVASQIPCLTTRAGVQVFFSSGPHNQNFICVCRPHELNIFHPQRTSKSQALKTKVNSATIGGIHQSDSRGIVVEPYLTSGLRVN